MYEPMTVHITALLAGDLCVSGESRHTGLWDTVLTDSLTVLFCDVNVSHVDNSIYILENNM